MSNDVAEDWVRKGITVSKVHSMGTTATSNESQLDCVFLGPTAMYGFPGRGHTFRLINALQTAVVAALWEHETQKQMP